MDFGVIFTILFTQPITNLLVACYQFLQFLHVPFALGFSFILLTIIIRIILLPLTSSQIRASKKMQDLTPHLAGIRQKHKEDKKRQQEETLKLYKEHGVNPATGCLPVLLQIPIIWSLYHVLTTVVSVTNAEKLAEMNRLLYSDALRLTTLWDTAFFGIPLSASPSKELTTMPFLILVPVLTGVFQLILSKMMMPERMPQGKQDDFQTTFAKQSLFIFPIMIGFFSYTLPFGLSLYWNAFTIFGILQQYFLVGPGGLKPWLAKIKK